MLGRLLKHPAAIAPRMVRLSSAARMMSQDAGALTYFAMLRSRGEVPQLIAAYGGVKMKVEKI